MKDEISVADSSAQKNAHGILVRYSTRSGR